MNKVKRIIGLLWMAIAPAVIFLMIRAAIINISAGGEKDINRPVPWIIIIGIFTPIAIGLMIFGYYCLNGEYDNLPEKEKIQTAD